MRKILLALLLVLASAVPAAPQANVVPSTMSSAAITGTVAAAITLIPGVAGQRIYVTALLLVPATGSVVTIQQGTGAACGTGTLSVIGVMTFAAGQVLEFGTGNGAVLALETGNSLCITIATAVAPGSIAYARF